MGWLAQAKVMVLISLKACVLICASKNNGSPWKANSSGRMPWPDPCAERLPEGSADTGRYSIWPKGPFGISRKSMKIMETQWKSMKINENQWKSWKIKQNQWKSMKISANQRKSMKANENQKISTWMLICASKNNGLSSIRFICISKNNSFDKFDSRQMNLHKQK